MDRRHSPASEPCSFTSLAVRDDGAVALMVAVLIVVLLAFAAVTVDAGAYYSHRRQMQTGADAAALAGVQELPGDPGMAVAVAENYASINAPEASDSQFTVSSTFVANDTITVDLLDPAMGLFFARAIGRDTAEVDAHATAIIGSPTTYGSGLMPFGICATGTTEAPYGYDPGQMIELVMDNGDQEQGNWHFVDLTPFTDGETNTKGVISVGGTSDPVSIGDEIDTQTGSPTNPNFSSLVDYFNETCGPHDLGELHVEDGIVEPTHESDGSHCNRLITCPVIIIAQGDPYDWDSVNGTTTTIVVGFLNMFIHNDPDFKDGVLLSEFVQVVPGDTFDPGGYVDYAGVVYWLSE
ncbi:MAG: Tad domain-containing protein [Coriobacteriia bacterium]|nr:Tad domain-containing protein [Coriobacteriia bacterium]